MITINYVKPSTHTIGDILFNQETPWGCWYVTLVRPSYGRCEVGFPPNSGERSLNGDRSCDHWNIRGEISQNVPGVSGPGFTLEGLTFPGYPKGPGQIQPRLVVGPGYSCSGDGEKRPKIWYNSWYWAQSWVESFYLSITESDTQLVIECNWCDVNASVFGTERLYRQTKTTWSYAEPLPTESEDSFAAPYTCVRKMRNVILEPETGTHHYVKVDGIPLWDDVAQQRVKDNLLYHTGLLVAHLPPKPQNFCEQVDVDTVESCKVVKINTLALAKDLANIKTVATWARALPKIHTFRQAASGYLGYKYGAPLTASDVIKLVSSLGKVGRRKQWRGKSIARSRASFSAASTVPGCGDWTCDYNVKLYYTPIDTAWAGLRRSLMDYGLYPSRKNLWDFIPYSFTLDWVANVSQYLDTADAHDYLSMIEVKGVVRSTRYRTTVPGSHLGDFGGTAEVIIYNRSVSPTLILDDPSFQISNPSSHLLEGGALIAARSKF